MSVRAELELPSRARNSEQTSRTGSRSCRPFPGSPLLLCQLVLVLVVATFSVSQATTTIRPVSVSSDGLKAAWTLIARFSDTMSATGSDPGLTAEQFREMLTTSTGHTEEYIGRVLGTCEGENCDVDVGCPGTQAIFDQFSESGQLRRDGLFGALPVALSTLSAPSCTEKADDLEKTLNVKEKPRPTLTETWLYGLGFCTLVAVIISNIGALLGPCMESRMFKRLLQFLVSMGAGSLATTGLLVLMPEAFDIVEIEELDSYVWKATLSILSIFTFFSSERILKTWLHNRKKTKEQKDNFMHPLTEGRFTPTSTNGSTDLSTITKTPRQDQGHGHSHDIVSGQGEEDRMTLAWMVMGGDVLHNFVDGLSVGAAFTEDIGLGISVSLAIVCEELPHELADIAILLHAGIPIRRAIWINFLSACSIYVGLILGILIGTNIHAANLWIFAMAGGLFLYIPLVDMLPDMRSHLDQLLAEGSDEAKTVAVLHFIGLLMGTAIIVTIVNVTGFIDV